ncbi:hypothetical protein Tco_1275758 [Tanacetum coccineum]
MYPFPKVEEVGSLMGFQYKCFLHPLKEDNQIWMSEEDEEKTTFCTDRGVFCYTQMPKGLKNSEDTYQRLMDMVFEGQIGINKVNMKLNPNECVFGIEKGKFLGYVVTLEGVRVDPEKARAITG